MRIAMRHRRNLTGRFILDNRGVAAVEFALIAPVMIVMLTGIIEISNFMAAQRRAVEAAHVCADLISQESDVSDSDLSDIVSASRYVMTPFDDSDLKVGVSSVRFDDSTGAAYVDWTYSHNSGSVDDATTLADGLGDAGESVIIVSAEYDYTPLLNAIISGTYTISETGYAKPRALSYVGKY